MLISHFKHTVLFRNLRIWFLNDGMLLQPYLVQGKYQRLQQKYDYLRRLARNPKNKLGFVGNCTISHDYNYINYILRKGSNGKPKDKNI